MKKSADKVQRRSFLKGAAVAGAAVGTGAVTSQTLADVAEEQPEKVAKKGYRETEHIREYYRLARF